MKLLNRTRYRYRNIFAPMPVLSLALQREEGEPAGLSPAAVAALSAALPPVNRLRVQVGGREQPALEGLGGETGIFLTAALLPSLLLQQVGLAVERFGVHRTGESGAIVFFQCDDWAVAEAVAAALPPLMAALTREAGAAGFAAAAAAASQRLRHARLDQTTLALAGAARAQDVPWQRLGAYDSLIQLGWGARQSLLRESVIGPASALGQIMARDKPSTLARLWQFTLPVPRFACVQSAEEAIAAAATLGGRVVLKPVGGTKAIGVSTGLSDAAAIERAFATARRFGPRVLVEQHIDGADHRLLVVGGRLVAAALRVPGGVAGDGSSSVAALLAALNRDPRRGRGFDKLMNRIEIDAEAQQLLAAQGLTLDSVPAAGRWVPLRRVGNISQGGLAVDVTDRVHPVNAAAAVAAAEALGLPVAGVDFLSPDIGRSWEEVGGAICEVNGCPGLRPHWIADPNRDVVTPILRLAFAEGDDGRIPVAAVTGSHGKTTVTRMTGAILAAAGPGVGTATTDGVKLDGRWLVRGDYAGSNGADLLFAHPATRAAVLETARGGIITRGFGFDRCDVAAVTYVDNDHLGFMGVHTLDDLAAVKGRLVELASRAVVLNLADPRTRQMAARRQAGVRLIWVRPPGTTLEAGLEYEPGDLVEVASWQGRPWILYRAGDTTTPLMEMAALPATDGGLLVFNGANACFAAAIAFGLGQSLEAVVGGLSGFRLGATDSPGRYQLMQGAGRSVLLDGAQPNAGRGGQRHSRRALCRSPSPLCLRGRRAPHGRLYGAALGKSRRPLPTLRLLRACGVADGARRRLDQRDSGGGPAFVRRRAGADRNRLVAVVGDRSALRPVAAGRSAGRPGRRSA